MTATSLHRIELEVSDAISRAAASMPRKVLSQRTGLSERYIKSLRAGEHKPSVPAALALALQHPELRSFFLRILGAAPGPASAALLREAAEIVEQWGARQPEPGDRAGGVSMSVGDAIAAVVAWLAVLACHLIRRGARADREAAARTMRGRASEPVEVEATRRMRP